MMLDQDSFFCVIGQDEMKKSILLVAPFVLLLSCVVYAALMNHTQSTFFSQFSLRELVEKNQSKFGLNCSGGGIGGGGGGGGRRGFHFHKGETFSCRTQTVEGEQFDETKFIASLKSEIEKRLSASEATIVDSGIPDASSFYFEYGIGNTLGHLEISGKLLRENYYSLKANLDEVTK
jgi:hypothetical protein